jgi:Na+-driven multidrug efflux pump
VHVLGLWGFSALFALLGAEGEPLALAVAYSNIWLLGFLFFAVSMVGTNLLRAVGNAAMPGIVMTLGSVLQILFGPFLIFGWLGLPALGIEGAAWAFVLARLISFALCMYWLTAKEGMLRPGLQGLLASWRDILHVGVPATLTNTVAPLSGAVLLWLLADYGAGVVAGYGVAMRSMR